MYKQCKDKTHFWKWVESSKDVNSWFYNKAIPDPSLGILWYKIILEANHIKVASTEKGKGQNRNGQQADNHLNCDVSNEAENNWSMWSVGQLHICLIKWLGISNLGRQNGTTRSQTHSYYWELQLSAMYV